MSSPPLRPRNHLPGRAPQSRLRSPLPPPGSQELLARPCSRGPGGGAAAQASPRRGLRAEAPAAPSPGLDPHRTAPAAAARVPRRPASYLAGPHAAAERAPFPRQEPSAGAAPARRAGRARGGGGGLPGGVGSRSPSWSPSAAGPPARAATARRDLGCGLSAPGLSFPPLKGVCVGGGGGEDGYRPGRRRHPSRDEVRALGSVWPLQPMGREAGYTQCRRVGGGTVVPAFPTDSARPLNKHLVTAASSQVPWPLPRSTAAPAGRQCPAPSPPSLPSSQMKKLRPREGQPLVQSCTAGGGCSHPPWHHVP